MRIIEPTESEITENWVMEGKRVVGDQNVERIEWLIKVHLQRVAGGGWETLYRDPSDGRFWELTYPRGEMHGGGPRQLIQISVSEAEVKYNLS